MNAVVQERLQRWPLVTQQANRAESFFEDARLVNAFAEKDPNTGEWVVQKRIGYVLDYTAEAGSGGNGMYAFGQLGANKSVYSAFSHLAGVPPAFGYVGNIYKDGVSFATSLDGLPPGTNYYWTEDQATPSRHLVFGGRGNVYYTTGSGVSTAPIPTHIGWLRGLAYLDQTIYCMDQAGQIFGSGFNDPSTWSTLNLVMANAIPGEGIELTQQLNYVIALKSNSMEVFYDAANPTGSPLSPVLGALSNYGGIAGTVQTIDNVLLFASSNKTVSPQVVRVDNLQVTPVSTPPVERLLDQVLTPVPATGPPAVGPSSWTFKHGGHRFYGLTFQGTGSLVGFTMVYDIDQNLWYQWTDPNGSFWPVAAMTYDSMLHHVLQGISDGNVYVFEGDYEYPTDNGIVAPVDIYTPNADFGTRRRKALYKMYFNADQKDGSSLLVSRSDDDYKTWSVPRSVDLSRRRPEMRMEGTFTRRAYRFRHASPTRFRIRSVDLQMELGTN